MRVKVDYRSTSKETFKRFCEDHPNLNLSYTEWADILCTFNEEFRDHILETGNREKMPHGLGSFSIIKKKRKLKKKTPDGKEFINLPIDWKKTREKGKKIYIMNSHTEGYFFGWIWFKRQARTKFATLWRFKPSRVTSRMIAHYINKDNKYQHLYRQWKKI